MSNKQDINAPIRVLLLGGETEIGTAILAYSHDRSDYEWVCPTESELLSTGGRDLLDSLQYDAIIDALSLRNALQTDYAKYQQVLKHLSETSTAPLLMLSSSRVFSGDKAVPYSESDQPDGDDDYAQALIQSEAIVLAKEGNFILRTGWLFTGQGDDFVCRTLELIQDGVNLAYKDNSVGSPTPVSDLARVILSMVSQTHYGAQNKGVYHYCCAEEISWVKLVETIAASYSQLNQSVQPEVETIEGISEEDALLKIKRQSLSCRRVFNHFGVKQRPWRSSLRALIKQLYMDSFSHDKR
ncbi:SDR family oxidoreductase [Marinomonas epiphytica]